jgi:uncharacterized protein (TIGR02246 family)
LEGESGNPAYSSTLFDEYRCEGGAALDAQTMTAAAIRYAEAWCTQDPQRVAAFFSHDGSLCVNEGAAAVGRDAIAEVAQGFMTTFPDMRVSMDELVFKPEGAVFHWTLTGTNTGLGGTGNRVRVSGYEVWRFDANGLIAESKGHFDIAEYDRQLREGIAD